MIGWAILAIVIIVAFAGGINWWFWADARRSRARRRLLPDTGAGAGASDGEWSVAAITARVEQERDGTVAPLLPQRTAACLRPYILPSPQPRRPSPPAVTDPAPTPRLGFPAVSPADLLVLQRVRDGLHRLP